MSNELFKTIEAQGRLITELRAENEELQKQLNIFFTPNWSNYMKLHS